MPSTVWKGQLAFGLVSVPIRIYRAARQERIRFRQVYRSAPVERGGRIAARAAEADEDPAEAVGFHAPEPGVHERPQPKVWASQEKAPESVIPARREYRDETGEEMIAAPDLLKGAEYAKGHFAVFKPQELRSFNVPTSSQMEIISFVKLNEIDPVYFNASYYVAPDRGGEKPYALLFRAMKKTGYAALASVAMHGRNQILTLRPGEHGILMHTLFFENEVHKTDEFRTDAELVSSAEMKLAEMLISQLAAKFVPSQFHDERLEQMRAAIQQKARTAGAVAGGAAERPSAPVVDIMEALRASLTRKPAGRASGNPAGRSHKRATR